MFPYFTVWSTTIHTMWLWILLCILIFLGVAFYYCKKYTLKFYKVLSFSWFFFLFPYILGRYTTIVLDTRTIVSLDPNFWLSILSPYNYSFHILGVVVGFAIALLLFLRSSSGSFEKRQWIDTLFYATAMSTIAFGFFALLWDTIIGKQTVERYGLENIFHKESATYNYVKTHPIWIYISIASMISLMISYFFHQIIRKYGTWIIWFLSLLLWLNIIYMLVDYPRRWFIYIGEEVIWMLGYGFDIFNFSSMFLWVCVIFYWIKVRRWS